MPDRSIFLRPSFVAWLSSEQTFAALMGAIALQKLPFPVQVTPADCCCPWTCLEYLVTATSKPVNAGSASLTGRQQSSRASVYPASSPGRWLCELTAVVQRGDPSFLNQIGLSAGKRLSADNAAPGQLKTDGDFAMTSVYFTDDSEQAEGVCILGFRGKPVRSRSMAIPANIEEPLLKPADGGRMQGSEP